MATKKELNEIIDFLTEEYIKKIVDEIGCKDFLMLMTVEDLNDLEDYEEEEQILIKELYNSPQYKQAKQTFDEFVEKRKPLLLQLIEILNEEEEYNVEEEYQQIIDEYNSDFDFKFNDYIGIYDDYVEEDNINDIEDEDISDEQYDVFEEQMEDVFTDINNIHSNISDIEGNLNRYFPNEFELKEEIFSLLKEIEEKTDIISNKIMKLVNYME